MRTTATENTNIKNFDPLAVIKNAVESSSCDTFTINQNYELLDNNGSNVLSAKLFDSRALIDYFDRLYEGLPSFVIVDAEADFYVFKKRLDDLQFLKAKHNEDTVAVRKLSRGLCMAENDHPAEIASIRIDCLGMRIYDEIGKPLQAKNLLINDVKTLLKGFCMQLEVSKAQILGLIA